MSASECHTCYTLTTKQCGGCKKAFFCSPLCQKMLWRTHKLHCQEIDSPIFIRQPKFTMQEFNLMMGIGMAASDVTNKDLELSKIWKGHTESQKQAKFQRFVASVESMEESYRHSTLIGSRLQVCSVLVQRSISTPSAVGPIEEFESTGLQPFYDMVTFENAQVGLQIEDHKKLFNLIFSYFSLKSVPEKLQKEALLLKSEAAERVVEEMRNLERNRVKNWKFIKKYIFAVVLQIGTL